MTSQTKQFKLAELADHIQAKLYGDAEQIITGIATLTDAQPHQIAFLDNPKYQSQLSATRAGAVILAEKNRELCPTAALVVEYPYMAYAKIAQLFWNKPEPYYGIHPTAVIDATAAVAKDASIGPYAVVGRNVTIGAKAIIGAHCVVSDACEIGEGAELMAHVTLYHQVRIGKYSLIHSGVVIGSDGFGFAPGAKGYEKIPQLGGVVIGDYVEIGANTTIDRGALNDTVIENGVKLDNQIQVGHNVRIGENTVIAGCTGIAGSTEIGKNCMIGGASGFAGHIEIANNVMLTGMAMVTHSIKESGVYASGTGLLPRAEWQKAVVRFRQLNELSKKVQQLEAKLEEKKS